MSESFDEFQPAPNEWDEFQPANPGPSARDVLKAVSSIDPAQASKASKLAKKYNAADEVLLRTLQDAEMVDRINTATTKLDKAPVLADYMRNSPFVAAQAQKDIDPLVKISDFLSDTGGSVKAGLFNASKGAAGTFRAGFELIAPALDFLEPVTEIGGNPLRRIAEGFDLQAQAAGATAKAAAPKTDGIIESGFQSGVQSLTQNLLALPLAFAPGGQGAALSVMTASTGGNAYQDARDKGLPMSQALPYAASQAAIEYATEKMPLGQLIKDVKVGTPFFQTLINQVKGEVLGEQIATVLQDMNDWAVLNPEKSFNSYLEERPSAAAQTLVATLVGVGGNVTVTTGVQKVLDTVSTVGQRQDKAERDAAKLQNLMASAAEATLRQNNPETFAQLVQHMADNTEGAPKSVYIDAQVFNQAVQTLTPEQLAQAFPSVTPEQIAEAVTTNRTVEVPIGEALAAVPGTPLEQVFLQNARSAPNALSLADAQTQGEQAAEWIKTEAERVLQQAQDQTTWQTSSEGVRTTILDQLNQAGRFTPEVNEAYALLHANFFSTMAAHTGVTPQEMYDRFALKVVAGSQQAGAGNLEQGSTLDDVRQQWADAGIKHAVTESRGRLTLSQIIVPDTERSSGKGTAAMQALVDYADRTGQRVELSPSADFGGNKKRLVEFYKRFGFVENKGRNKDYEVSESMYRPAQALNQSAQVDELTGLLLNPDGTVTVYHHTSADKAAQISKTGKLKSAAEPDVYVTTRKETDTGYGDTAVAIRVNPELLQIDDEFPDGRVDYRIATGKPGGSIAVKVGEYAGGQYNQQARGTFNPQSLLITLNENADLSTFLHESGHFFLEVMADLASQPNAPAQVRENMDKLLKWFGVPDLATWKGYALDQKRPYHEKFAESFEAYLLEGKAPSQELQPLFRRFRSWLVNVYKSLKEFMRGRDLNMNDEVRQVFDRMLATDEQIRQAEEAAGMLPDFDATNEAIEKLQARSLRDLKWTVGARSRALKALQKEAANLRKAVEAEVRAEVDDMPVYQAQAAIDRIKGEPSTEQLETIAEATGFTSASEMLTAIGKADTKAAMIEGMTDQRMLENFGELATPQAIEEAANDAVHNEARARALATELKGQADALNPRQQTGTDRNGRPVTVNALVAAAKQFAENITARRKVKDLKKAAAQHRAAEARAGKAWQEATAKGKTQEAVQAKRDQLLNNYAAKSMQEADAEITKVIDYFKKFDKDTIRKNIPISYLDQIDALLENMDLRKSVSRTELERRASLRKWVESQQAIGLDPIVPDELMENAQRISYKEMTVDELRSMRDVIKNIEHLGRLKSKLLAAKDKREFDAAVDAWAKEIRDNGGKPLPVKLEGDSRPVKMFKSAWVDHRKLNSLIRQFAANADNSEGFKLLIRSMNERGTQEDVMIEKASVRLAEIHAPIEKLPGGFSGAKLFIPEINNSLTRAGRLAVALNWGNEQNRQRVRDGDNWTNEQVDAILRTLTPVELKFVNDVWEYLDSYWPEIKAKQERVSGVVEDKVQADPFTVTLADGTEVQMRGGYYPIKYDGDRSLKSQKQEAEQIAKDMLRGAMLRPATRRGHTKARVDEVIGRPVKKDLSVITQHVTQVVHDLAWHEWAIDANRLMNDPRIASAIRDYYGAETHRAMTDAIEAIVVGDVAKQTSIDQLLLMMRANVTRSIMGASLTTALLQPFGLTQSMARIGVTPVLKGAGRWAGDALRMESTVKWVGEKSDFMRLRSKTFNRELREISQRVRGKSKIAQVADASLFMLMQKMQLVADIPTWVGAYEKALNSGAEEATAVQLADEAVLSSQGGGNTRDLAAVQRDHPFLTQFYSYFNTTLQLVTESTAATDFKNPRAVAGWLGDMMLLAVVPAILPALITFSLKGGGEDDEPEEWAKRLVEWQAGYMLGMFVGLRELPALWSPFDYGGPPAAKLINDGRRLVQQANQGEIDEPAVLATIGFLGTALGIPTTQIVRSYKGWKAWDEGDAPASSILFGPPPKE